RDYDQNTQAGQDLRRMARAGLDEIVLMGYWDDWDRDPEWVREGLEGASELVDDEADLSVVLDGDMGVRRTRLTLQALGPWTARASWFNYGEWTEHEFDRLERAIDGHHREGPMPRPDHVSVVVRIDTEPDYRPSYATVHPEMIDSVVEMLGRERAPATFVTVGRLAELQTDAMRRVAAAGHEVASHSYNHEQIDSLPLDEQMRSVDRGLATLQDLGFDVRGFGAPRNSITDEARDRLMQWNLEYDGSAAYDPLAGLLDVHYAPRSNGGDDRILVIPFVVPNDWDARYIAEMSAEEMLDAWTRRLDRVVASGEPVFVLDVHQWSISDPDNLDALRGFIRYARGCEVCRVETLRAAARNARSVLDRYELPGTTSGAGTIDTPLAIPDRPRRQP
ncbi:MAG: polysaccharide deacetylase family protein, partial [Thermoleophilia bacterium]|nr:polysaccharide deacetylase family protein [Thermoleophilia bacterium]